MLGKDGHVKMKAATRIGVLCSQLRYVFLILLLRFFRPLDPLELISDACSMLSSRNRLKARISEISAKR